MVICKIMYSFVLGLIRSFADVLLNRKASLTTNDWTCQVCRGCYEPHGIMTDELRLEFIHHYGMDKLDTLQQNYLPYRRRPYDETDEETKQAIYKATRETDTR